MTEASAQGGGVKGRGEFEPGGGAGFVGVVSASCVLAVCGVAFCVARYLQTRRDRSVRGPWRKMGKERPDGGDLGRPPRAPSGPNRSPFAFSARRFYRHLQAGSVGDLPLVEDLDRASGVSTEGSEGNDRVGTPPSSMGNVVDLPSPRHNRRSNSISEPATRPTPADLVGDDLVLRGFAGGISEPKPRHPSRHSTPYHGLRSVGELRVNIGGVGGFRETADGRRPTTPPAGASGAAPFFGEKRLTHP